MTKSTSSHENNMQTHLKCWFLNCQTNILCA